MDQLIFHTSRISYPTALSMKTNSLDIYLFKRVTVAKRIEHCKSTGGGVTPSHLNVAERTRRLSVSFPIFRAT